MMIPDILQFILIAAALAFAAASTLFLKDVGHKTKVKEQPYDTDIR